MFSVESQLSIEFAEALLSKLLDPEEKVRAAVCKMYSQLDYETALHHVSDNQLQSVAGRGVDKKVKHNYLGNMVIHHQIVALRPSGSISCRRQAVQSCVPRNVRPARLVSAPL